MVTGDSALLAFPMKGGAGKQVKVNAGIVFGAGMQWSNLEMRVVGGGTVVMFTQVLFETRRLHASQLIENNGIRIPPTPNHVIRDEDFKDVVQGYTLGPFYDAIFDENHVALVFMNLNYLYSERGGRFVGADYEVMLAFQGKRLQDDR